jgi:glycosyltransferase involved in cell wall biosynthesis
MRLVLIGDGDSPHLLKWARALSPRVELFAASSRGFLPGFDAVLPAVRRLALATNPRFEGGNAGLLKTLPRLAAWLRHLQPDWLHAHYLTSHGTLAWAARRLGVRARIAGSAWGSDILVTPARSAALRWLTQRVLRASDLATSDSHHMADCMRALGAGEVMVFPFGLEGMPAARGRPKDDALFYANRGLEPIYAPGRVIEAFAAIAAAWPEARLQIANDGSLRAGLESDVRQRGLQGRVSFLGRLDEAAQEECYAQARWYFSLPRSDSVSVSVLEAMAQGCIPILSDLPANRELVRDGDNGCLLADGAQPGVAGLQGLLARGETIAAANRAWIEAHALFPAAVDRFVARLQAFPPLR